MIVDRTLDVGICLEVLSDAYIFDSISEDTATIESIKVDVINDYWLKIEVEDRVIGVVQFKQVFNKCFDSHIHILKEFRKEHSNDAGDLILNWCYENITGSLLYTNVPDFCDNVKRFLLSFGFTEQGILSNAWFKNGKQNNMTILTREV
tara:strand:- start:19 stop:465 length:447 start_codon:yes stop_codon:yes gene_type:complete